MNWLLQSAFTQILQPTFISVEGNFEGTAQVQLVSLLGQEIQGFNGELSSGNTLRIPTEGLAKGTYLVVVSKEGYTR